MSFIKSAFLICVERSQAVRLPTRVSQFCHLHRAGGRLRPCRQLAGEGLAGGGLRLEVRRHPLCDSGQRGGGLPRLAAEAGRRPGRRIDPGLQGRSKRKPMWRPEKMDSLLDLDQQARQSRRAEGNLGEKPGHRHGGDRHAQREREHGQGEAGRGRRNPQDHSHHRRLGIPHRGHQAGQRIADRNGQGGKEEISPSIPPKTVDH